MAKDIFNKIALSPMVMLDLANDHDLAPRVGIYDIAGRVIHEETLGSSTSDVLTLCDQVTGIKPGIYFIRVRFQGHLRTAKVVKL